MSALLDMSAVTLARSCAAISDIYRRLQRRRVGPDPQSRVVALLIWFLSSCPWLAVVYLQQRRHAAFEIAEEMASLELAALTMLDWFRDDSVRVRVMAAIETMRHPLRVRADEFLMCSCLASIIVDHNHRGLTVALPEAVQTYVRLWSYRSMSDRTAEQLRRLVWCRNARRHFGFLLLRNFMLVLTTFPQAKELSRDDQFERVCRV